VRGAGDSPRDLRRAPGDLPGLRRGEDAALAPAQVEDEVDGGVHIGVEGRTGAFEDPLEPDRDLFARVDRGVVWDAVESEAERAARPLASDPAPVLLAAAGDAALPAGQRVAADSERRGRDHQVLDP